MNDLTEDQQRLAAVRLYVTERLRQTRSVAEKYAMRPDPPTPGEVAASGSLGLLMTHLEKIAELAGCEAGMDD